MLNVSPHRLQVWRPNIEFQIKGQWGYIHTYIIPSQADRSLPVYKAKFISNSHRANLEKAFVHVVTREPSDKMASFGATQTSLVKLGELCANIIPRTVCEFLFSSSEPLLIETNDPIFPWELVRHKDQTLGIFRPVGRLTPLVKDIATVPRLRSLECSALLIDDPTSTLQYATDEILAVAQKLREEAQFNSITIIPQGEGTRERLRSTMQTSYTLVHIVGHVSFDKNGVVKVGLGEATSLTTHDLQNLHSNFAVVFIDGCWGAQVEDLQSQEAVMTPQTTGPQLEGLAQAFLERGARIIVSALWPISDEQANLFAKAFYNQIVRGESFGSALQHVHADKAGETVSGNTWASYILYGDPTLTLKAVY